MIIISGIIIQLQDQQVLRPLLLVYNQMKKKLLVNVKVP